LYQFISDLAAKSNDMKSVQHGTDRVAYQKLAVLSLTNFWLRLCAIIPLYHTLFRCLIII